MGTVAQVLDEARPVLARLELIQHGATTQLDPTKGSRNVDRPYVPQGESNPPHLVFRERITTAPTAAAARIILAEARVELAHCTMRTIVVVHEESLAELKARIVRDGVGWTRREVSFALRCTPRLVGVARTEANRHPETGYALPGNDEDPWAHARELRGQGMTLRQIAMITRIPRSTLNDRL